MLHASSHVESVNRGWKSTPSAARDSGCFRISFQQGKPWVVGADTGPVFFGRPRAFQHVVTAGNANPARRCSRFVCAGLRDSGSLRCSGPLRRIRVRNHPCRTRRTVVLLVGEQVGAVASDSGGTFIPRGHHRRFCRRGLVLCGRGLRMAALCPCCRHRRRSAVFQFPTSCLGSRPNSRDYLRAEQQLRAPRAQPIRATLCVRCRARRSRTCRERGPEGALRGSHTFPMHRSPSVDCRTPPRSGPPDEELEFCRPPGERLRSARRNILSGQPLLVSQRPGGIHHRCRLTIHSRLAGLIGAGCHLGARGSKAQQTDIRVR